VRQPPRSRSLLVPLLVAGCASPLPGASTTTSGTSAPATFASSSGRVAAAAMAYDSIAVADAPPMSLTGTDGSGLELTKIDARAIVEGPLAYTELHLHFHNPEARVREGRFAITLPPGAALSRFAMQNGDAWMEAEVVEKMAARRAYEDFLHRRQDPALLEKAAGNEFSARVFPIPANGDKHLVISYSQELAATTASYVLPLRGLPTVGEITGSVRVARADRATLAWDETTLAQKAWKPDRDFVVPVPSPMSAVASGEWLAARVTVPADGSATDAPASLAILVDTSASRALGFQRQIAELGDLIEGLARRYGGGVELAVAAFDQDVLPIFSGRADRWTAEHEKALLARQPLGASSLATALTWAESAGMKRLVVVGDGVVTAGDTGDQLITRIKALRGKGIERLDTVLVGGIRDVDAARTWVSAGLVHDGAVIDLGAGADEAARRLGLPVRSDLAITVTGAAWSWPDRAIGVQPGDELVVYARGKAAVANATVQIGGTAVEVAGVRTSGILLARAAAQAEVARMERDLAATTDAKARTALREAIVAKSVASRVMSSLTAFLVLETEHDYVRFGIPRTALADILVVGPDGLRLEHRAQPVLIATPTTGVAKDKPTLDGPRKGDVDDLKQKKEMAGFHGDGTIDAADAEGGDMDARLALAEEGQGRGQAETEITGRVARPVPGIVSDHAPSPAAPPPPPERVAQDQYRGRPNGATGAGAAAGSAAPADAIGEDPRVERRPEPPAEPPASITTAAPSPDADATDEEKNSPPALDGKLAAIMKQIAANQLDDALVAALIWHKEEPGDVLGLIALGEALEASGDRPLAARAYGSLIDLFPGRADLRRFAGERLERVGAPGRDLAIDTYRRAVEDRPDHLTGHRLLAMALVRAGKLSEAFAAIEHGLAQAYPSNRFRGGDRLLREDFGMVGAAWIAQSPGVRADVMKRLEERGVALATESSLRFVLYWETDANDVDFHIRDAKGGHAWYSNKQLPSGGELYEDITTGYGPECFTINGTPAAGPYRLKIHYYSRGPMGYGMGVLEIMRHDGKGKLTFEHRPYVAMNDRAYVDLGSVSDGSARAVQLAK
jgi:hypothetical protein